MLHGIENNALLKSFPSCRRAVEEGWANGRARHYVVIAPAVLRHRA